jgi:hypothetical protein
MFADLGQLGVPPPPQADAVLPRTVASTTGNVAIAARPMKARRVVSTASDFFAVASGFESSRSGRELSAIGQPAIRHRPNLFSAKPHTFNGLTQT